MSELEAAAKFVAYFVITMVLFAILFAVVDHWINGGGG